jgi:hypothetical protein
MQTAIATARSGKRIAFWRSGDESLLYRVHGATADHTTTWRFLLSGRDRPP